jgi:hypothetical protein
MGDCCVARVARTATKKQTKVRTRDDFSRTEPSEALLNACTVAFAVGQSNYDIFGCLTVLCTIRPG